MKPLLLVLIIIVLSSCGYQLQKKSTEASSEDVSEYSIKNCLYVRNSVNQIVSWKSQIPIQFYFSQSVPDQWKSAIKKAASVWVTNSGFQLIHINDDVSSSIASQNDGKNIIYWVDSGALFNYQQAQTTTRWTRNQLLDADVMVNSKDFAFFDLIPDANHEVHMESLLVHEFGHALGLKHTDELISVMYPELAYSQIRVDLAAMDNTSMECEYK